LSFIVNGLFSNINVSQGSVATYLRCGEIVNNHFNKGVLLSLSVIFFNR